MTQETAVILEEMRDWGQDDWADALEALEASNDADREALAAKDALIKELLKALEWYADQEIYKPHPHGLAFDRRDLSFTARAALAKAREVLP